MRYSIFGLATTAMLLLNAGGCVGEAGTSIAGREVIATGAPLHTVGVRRYDDTTARFSVNGRLVDVTPTQVSTTDRDVLQLPADWKDLQLLDRGTHIAVRVDGQPFGDLD